MIRRDPVDPAEADLPREPAPGATAKGALLPLVERIDDHNPMRMLLAVQAEVERRITMEADRTPGCLVVQELNRTWADHLREVAPGVLPPSGDEIEVELYPDDMPRGGVR